MIYEVFQSRKPIVSRENWMHFAAYQLRSGMGVLVLDRLKEPVFLQQETDFVKQIANELAIAIENALAYAEIKI